MHRFWDWYERHYVVNITLTSGLFLLQLIHLYWLSTHVVALRLFEVSTFTPPPFWQYAIIVVDYTEIPALLSTSILYIYELRREFAWRFILYLIMLNSQWLHLFWITDEFIISQLLGIPSHQPVILPLWLAWVALFIDYLELPVIADTIARVIKAGVTGRFVRFLKEEAKFHIWHL